MGVEVVGKDERDVSSANKLRSSAVSSRWTLVNCVWISPSLNFRWVSSRSFRLAWMGGKGGRWGHAFCLWFPGGL